jgi:H+/Cl- antiporter ClcA
LQNVKVYEVLARMGYAARGVIYLTIGALASLSVLGTDQEKPNSREAIISLNTQPYGEALLIALVIGLVGYVVWRLIQALNDA